MSHQGGRGSTPTLGQPYQPLRRDSVNLDKPYQPHRRDSLRRDSSVPPIIHSRSTPRQIRIERKDNGFGFTLRHFIVYPPEEGSEAGPPIQEPMDTIFVKSVKDRGPAVKAGLNIGDRLVSVNGEVVAGRSYAQVVQMIQKSRDSLFLVVVPRQDDILQVYFSEIAQNPESNRRLEGTPGPVGASSLAPGKSPWPASVCSSSSRESSPFSSKTSDSTRDSVYGHNKEYRGSRSTPKPVEEVEPLYATIGPPTTRKEERLAMPADTHSSMEHIYSAVPALAGSEATLSSTSDTATAQSHDSLDSDSSQQAGFVEKKEEEEQSSILANFHAQLNKIKQECDVVKLPPEPPKPVERSHDDIMAGFHAQLSKIRRDCEVKEDFLKNSTIPAYMSLGSPPKETQGGSPYRIASLAATMPPAKPKEPSPEPPKPPAKNFFMDIYAQEVSKMKSESTASVGPPAKKRNFDATQFNAYGLPLGYRKGHTYEMDSFSRNNYVIVGSRTLHCEPPQVYQPTPDPQPPACSECYGGPPPYHYPGPCYCTLCAPPPAPCPVCVPAHCALCTGAVMAAPAPLQRPSSLPGIQSMMPSSRDGLGAPPVHMHPDPVLVAVRGHSQTVASEFGFVSSSWSGAPERDSRRAPVTYRRSRYTHEDESEKNLRRTSYLQATKEAPMDVEILACESGLAPTHSIKKLKSIFSDKNPAPAELAGPPALPMPPSSPVLKEIPDTSSSPTEEAKIREGYLTCKVAIVDGKKAGDRSWKTVYAVLKSKTLYMFKDKKMAQDNMEYEEKPVKLVESEVEVANDYTKRKNVFRVKTDAGSEYLFQAENEILMKEWVHVIDKAAMAIIVDERKDSKFGRKLTSFRNRSPTGQSPASKSRKSSAEVIPPYKDKDKDKKTWKGKVVSKLQKIGGHKPLYPEGGSIGVPLDECPLYPGNSETELVPYLVKVCCDMICEKGLDIVGIYRVPGNNAAVTYLTEQINKGVDYFALEDQRWQDVNVVSSLLKSFFRKLPEPLFTVELYSLFIEASKIDVAGKRMETLRKLIRDLPEIHLETLKYLVSHLCLVAEHSVVNKMEVRNLAIVFGPTLVRTTDDNMVSMVTDMSQQCRIIESLLSNWEYFFTEEEVEPAMSENFEESQTVLGTGASQQSLMLANLQKLEDAGKMSSPKGDVSAKDIVSSIISAANRKMQRAATKGKKESSVECENERCTSVSRDALDGGRRESEAVIHGALQIASAVPGLMGSISAGSMPDSERNTPDLEPPGYGRQNSRGSLASPAQLSALGSPMRRGSLQIERHCQSKRGSICAYSGGAMCEATPMGEHCETRVAMIKSNNETFTNGHGENQEVVTGKLSLVNVPGFPRVTSGDDSMRPDSAPPARTSLSPPAAMPHPQLPEYKFPIETYAGLDRANAERIAKFEAETKAMLTQRSGLARSSNDLAGHQGLPPSPGLSTPSLTSTPGASLTTGSLSSLLSTTSLNPLTSLTTPVPDTSNPLDGGILVQEPYHTDAYNTPASLATGRRFLSLAYRNSLPNLQPAAPEEEEEEFDTGKVADRGTLQRMRVRGSRAEMEMDCAEDEAEREDTSHTEQLLNNLTASFDQKMRLLLDPHYQAVTSPSSPLEQCSRKQLAEARNLLQQVRASGRKVELRRTGRVDKRWANKTKEAEPSAVLREVNVEKVVKRSDSLTKQEKTDLNLRDKVGEKENSVGVTALRDQFEQRAVRESQGRLSIKPDIIKLKKKFSDRSGRGLKRRHTVGGTKDFSATVVELLVRGAEAWDRLAPLVSDQKLLSAEVLRAPVEERRLSLPVEQEEVGWRYSLPGLV